MTKKITFPIGNKIIFDSLAEIALKCEPKKPKNIEQFKKEVTDDLAEEAYLHSLTPSGEIGDNPTASNDSRIFLKAFDNIFSKRFGAIAASMDDEPKKKVENAIRKVKSALVELTSVYTKEMNPPKVKPRSELDKEINKYFNLFVMTLMFKEVGDILSIESHDIDRAIRVYKMLGISEDMSDAQKLKVLKSPENKKRFIEKVKSM